MDKKTLFGAAASLATWALSAQHNRLLRLSFPRQDGPDALLLVNTLDAKETISRDFRFEVELLSDSATIALDAMMWKMVTVSLVREDGSLRYFNGYVSQFRLIRADGGFVFYGMVLEPWLAQLQYGKDNRSFHNQSVIEITRSTLAAYPESDWDFQLVGEDARITCANQYDESDHNHLHRRWEALGLAYWYEHRIDGHTLWLTDDTTLAMAIDPGIEGEPAESIPFRKESGAIEDDAIHEWQPRRQLTPGSVTLASFDFKHPIGQSVTRGSMNSQGEAPEWEVYENTGAYGYKDSRDGDPMVRRRMEALDSRGQLFDAKGNDRTAQVGRSFKLTQHFSGVPDLARELRPGEPSVASREYLILSVEHKASNNYHIGRDAPSKYSNAFTCIRKSIAWRPGRDYNSVPARIYGPQTAIVVGPPGEEIYTDEYGRVRIQLHWDRLGQHDELSSPWVRVMTSWAGDRFGHISVPRVGQEVVVQFLDGNVDRPLIVGSTYNQDNMPPFGLPDNKTQSGMQTRSSVGAGIDNANVLRFEDRKGKEQLWLHAERDQLTEVEHDEDKWVGNDRRKTIDRDETTVVKRNRTETVGNNERITIHHDRSERVDHDEHIDIGANRAVEIGMNERETIGGNCNISVKGLKAETVWLAKALSVGLGYQVSVGGAMNTTVALSQSTEVLLNKLIKVGRAFDIDADDSFTVNVGPASFSMNKEGVITLTGTKIIIEAGGKVFVDGSEVLLNSGGEASPQAPRGDGPAASSLAATAPPSANSGEVVTGLGAEADALAAKSPTLQQQLKALQEQGVKIEYGEPGKGSHFERRAVPPTIIIDGNERSNPADAVGTLAHEVGHATNPYVATYLSKDAYINGTLADEASAQMNGMKVQREILTNGGPEIIIGNNKNAEYYNSVYDQFLRDGKRDAAIGAISERYRTGEQISGYLNGVHPTYGEYYANSYDEHMAEEAGKK